MIFRRGCSQSLGGMFAMYSLPCIYLAPTFLLIQQTNKDNKEGHDNIRYQHLCGVVGSCKMFHVSL